MGGKEYEMLSLYQQIRQMNLTGVTLLDRRDYATATNVFYQALTELLSRLTVPVDHEPAETRPFHQRCVPGEDNGLSNGGGEETSGRPGSPVDTSDLQQDGPAVTSVELTQHNGSLFDKDTFVIFNRGLLLNLSNSQDITHSCDSVSFYAASVALTYNVGLAHHLDGLEKGDRMLLTRALDFYFLAYVSVIDKDTPVGSKWSTSLVLGVLALVNNMGHIHATLCDFKRANICSEELTLRLEHLLDSQPGSSASHFSEEEYQILLWNATCFSEILHLCSPAA